MKNIIPFKKEIIFEKNIEEITSISLEHTLTIIDNDLSGNFIINGDYRNNGINIPFNKQIPFSIIVDDIYDTKNATIDIDDFYYEVKNNNTLFVSIDVLLDKLEKTYKEDLREIIDNTEDIVEVEETEKNNNGCNRDNINTSMGYTFNEEKYVCYNVYILKSGDTIDTVLDKYNVSIEELKDYNDLEDLKVGDKIIIPSEGD